MTNAEGYGTSPSEQFRAQMDLKDKSDSIAIGCSHTGELLLIQGDAVLLIESAEALRLFIKDMTDVADAWEKHGMLTKPDEWPEESKPR